MERAFTQNRIAARQISSVLMARYDVFLDPQGTELFLDVQTDLLDGFETRLVAPLMPQSTAPRPINRLHPVFAIDGKDYVMATHLLVAVPEAALTKPVANLAAHHDEIIAALDMIIHGF